MIEQHPSTAEDEADKARVSAIQRFWIDSMGVIQRSGFTEREAGLQMLVVAASFVGKTCGNEGAAQLCADQAWFFTQLENARAEAAQEADSAIRH